MPFEIFIIPGLICLFIGLRKGLKMKKRQQPLNEEGTIGNRQL